MPDKNTPEINLNELISGTEEEIAKAVKAELKKIVDAYAAAMQTCSGAQCEQISKWYLTVISAALYLLEKYTVKIPPEQAKKITIVCNDKKLRSLSFHQLNDDCCWAATGIILYRFKHGVEKKIQKGELLKEQEFFDAHVFPIEVSNSLRNAVSQGKITQNANARSDMSSLVSMYKDGQKMSAKDSEEFYSKLGDLDVYSQATAFKGTLLDFCTNSAYGLGLGVVGSTYPLGFLWAFFCNQCLKGNKWSDGKNAPVKTSYLNGSVSRHWFERVLGFHHSDPLKEKDFTYDFVKNKLKKGPFIMNIPYVVLTEAGKDLIEQLVLWAKNSEEGLHFVIVYGQKVVNNEVVLLVVNTLDYDSGDVQFTEIPFDDVKTAIRLSKGSMAVITT